MYAVGRRINLNEDGVPAPAQIPARRKHTEVELLQEGTSSPKNGLVSSDNSMTGSNDNSENEEEFSDNEGDIMDDLIEQGHSTVTNSKPNDDVNCKIARLFTDNYVDAVPETYLDPVSSILADNITSWCCRPPAREQVKTLFKNCMILKNIDGLQQDMINEVLYKFLPRSAKMSDQKIKGVCNFIARSMGPVIQVFERLCLIETQGNQLTKTMFETLPFSVTELRESLGNSLKLSSAAHAILLQRRKSGLKPLFGFQISLFDERF